MLLAALMLGLGSTFTSCSDDDKLSDEEKQQQQEEKVMQQDLLTNEFVNMMSKLASVEAIPDDWQTKTFTATIGEPSQQSEATRLVATNSLEAAAMRFEDLTGVDVSILDSYEWTRDFGTLTYKKSRDGQSWATVEVDIKQLPGLKRIVYCAPDQMGLNGDFTGNAYYRFGDVIKKNGVYWICVRPCFGVEGKQTSHWMTIDPQLPEKNLVTVNRNDGQEVKLPTKLATSKEHTGNMAEMLYAMLHPQLWRDWYDQTDNKKLAIFSDFSQKYISYHNQYFWTKVRQAWDYHNLWNTIFHTDREVLEDMQKIDFFVEGHWKGWFGKSYSLRTLTYSGGNWKTVKDAKVTYDQTADKHLLNITDWLDDGYCEFFEPHRAYVARYATGKELMGSTPNEFQPMAGANGIEDVYVFNNYYNQPVGSGKDNVPKVFTKQDCGGFEGRGFFVQGDVVKDENGSLWFCNQPAKSNSDPNACEYAYFISYDKNALGASPTSGEITNFRNLPSKNLAMQMLYCLENLVHNAENAPASKDEAHAQQMRHILDYAGIDLFKMVGIRDTLHTYRDDKGKAVQTVDVPCDFLSALYRGEDGLIYIIRCIGDYTAAQKNGTRDFAWRFYDKYTQKLTTEPHYMELNDLSKADIIKDYNQDRWVGLSWHLIDLGKKESQFVASPGVRTLPVGTNDLSIWLYANQKPRGYIQGGLVSNMYNEPVHAFAVKRVLDQKGQMPQLRFEDGKPFTIVSALSLKDPIMFDELFQKPVVTSYNEYLNKMYLNDQPGYHFGMDNTK